VAVLEKNKMFSKCFQNVFKMFSKCFQNVSFFIRNINTLSINSQNDRDKSQYHKPIKQEKPTETK